MAREPFNEIWANSPDPAQFEEPPVGTFASGWEGGPAANPPEAKWENWWHNRVDVALQQLERGGCLDYDAGAVYEEGAIARGPDGNPYRSQQGNNQGNDPVTDAGTFWAREPAGIATEAEAQSLASLTRLLTPGRLNDAFKGINQSFETNGYQMLPGGLIIQWGRPSSTNGSQVNFPIAFPNVGFQVFLSDFVSDASGPQYLLGWYGLTQTKYNIRHPGTAEVSHSFLAIGW